MYYIENRSSSCIDALAVDFINKVAVFRYHNGREYTYKNVSRRSILNIALNPSVSLGFWTNNLKKLAKNKKSKTYCIGQTGLNFPDNLLTGAY